MRVIVCGGRDYNDWGRVCHVLGMLFDRCHVIVVNGGAGGADEMAREWARIHSISVETYPADWNAHGPAAGPLRNQEMLENGADLVVAFQGGRGTKDMIRRARSARVPVLDVPA